MTEIVKTRRIEKVAQSTPVDKGLIVDTLEGDSTTNAPSVRVVNESIKEINNSKTSITRNDDAITDFELVSPTSTDGTITRLKLKDPTTGETIYLKVDAESVEFVNGSIKATAKDVLLYTANALKDVAFWDPNTDYSGRDNIMKLAGVAIPATAEAKVELGKVEDLIPNYNDIVGNIETDDLISDLDMPIIEMKPSENDSHEEPDGDLGNSQNLE